MCDQRLPKANGYSQQTNGYSQQDAFSKFQTFPFRGPRGLTNTWSCFLAGCDITRVAEPLGFPEGTRGAQDECP